MSNETKAWVLRPFPDGTDRYKEFRERGIIALGWPQVDDLSSLKPNDWDGVKLALTKAYGQLPPYTHGQWAGNFYRFLFDMKVGDLVLIPYFGETTIGRITSGYECVKGDLSEAPHVRRVEWLRQPIERAGQPEEIVTVLKGRQTVYRAWLADSSIAQILSNTYCWHDAGSSNGASTRLAQSMLESISQGRQPGMNQNTFENPVFPALLRAGLTITPQHTRNSPGDADVDVVVELVPDLFVYFQLKYQVKAGKAEVDWAKRQVREAVKHAQAQPDNSARYIPVVVFAGKLAEGLSTGWHHEEGQEAVLVLALNEMDEWFSRWVESMSARELLRMFPQLSV